MTLTDEERAACAVYSSAARKAWAEGQTDATAWRALVKEIGNDKTAYLKWFAWRDEQDKAQEVGDDR